MSFGTILVQCDADKKLLLRLAVAAGLAERFGSHLVGLHARPPFQPPVMFDGGVIVDMGDFFELHQEKTKADEAAAAAAFTEAMRGKEISKEWRVVDGLLDDELVAQSRAADLVVVGQTDPDATTSTPSDLPQHVALASGRPVLVVPHVGAQAALGKTVLLCWNASRESARAATEALPLLKAASQVTVLIVDENAAASGESAGHAADAVRWLAGHGVKAAVRRDVADSVDVGDVILSRVADLGADLIVMGIYGHSRLREMVLGGASRTLLAGMTVPVFMAH
jgi:nucleotide-binding universal stress UspA family protein